MEVASPCQQRASLPAHVSPLLPVVEGATTVLLWRADHKPDLQASKYVVGHLHTHSATK